MTEFERQVISTFMEEGVNFNKLLLDTLLTQEKEINRNFDMIEQQMNALIDRVNALTEQLEAVDSDLALTSDIVDEIDDELAEIKEMMVDGAQSAEQPLVVEITVEREVEEELTDADDVCGEDGFVCPICVEQEAQAKADFELQHGFSPDDILKTIQAIFNPYENKTKGNEE